MSINQDIKQRWVEDLRANSDKQGIGSLRRGKPGAPAQDTFCCLGRLCELAVQDGVIPPPRQDLDFDQGPNESYAYANRNELAGLLMANTGCLPRDVRHWAGIPEVLGDTIRVQIDPSALSPAAFRGLTKVTNNSFRDPPSIWTLAELNDAGVSFPVIAEIIDTFL